MLAPLPLNESKIVTLKVAATNGPHPRMRRRAQAVLGHHRGLYLSQLAALYAVGYNVVSRGLPGRMPLLAPPHALCLAVARPAAR